MKNIKLVIEYDGSQYFGWQKQKNSRSIQGTLEQVLSEVLKEDIEVIGCSRTDAGVHAKAYVLNFKSETKIPAEKIKYALNNKLPRDIVVLDSREVSEDFHARYSSTGKTYVYTILNREMPSAIERNYVYHHPYNLNINAMKEACKFFIGTHDFSAFKNTGSSVQTSIRTITKLEIDNKEDRIKIYISADGFLYNMVRIIVGTLILVGEGKLKPEEIDKIIKSKDRKKAGKTAPAQGLCLLTSMYI